MRGRALDAAIPVVGACIGVALAPTGVTTLDALLAGVIAVALRLFSTSPPKADNRPTARTHEPSGENHSLLSEIPVPLVIIDETGTVQFATSETAKMLGRAVTGLHVSSVFRAPSVISAVEEAISGGQEDTFDFRLRRPRERTMTATVRPLLRKDEPTVVVMTLRDNTGHYRLDETRSDFVANASHELRTPLAAISGLVETLRGPARDDPVAQARFLDTIAKQTDRMTRLVNDLLSLSRIELEENVAPTDRHDLRGVLADALSAMRSVAEEQQVTLDVSLPADLPKVLASRDELIQVFVNLIDNAIRYGDQHVQVSVNILDSAVVIEVADDGPGIAGHDIPRLTERFYRANPGDSRAKGGTGLGLAIVKHIVNRHRGTLDIKSKPGEGARFIVTLPVPSP